MEEILKEVPSENFGGKESGNGEGEQKDDNAEQKIQDKIDTLLILEERGWLGDYTYYNAKTGGVAEVAEEVEDEEQGTEGNGYIELVHSMEAYRDELIDEGKIVEAGQFRPYWDYIILGHGRGEATPTEQTVDYRRITDGQPLTVLEFATVWLAMQIEPNSNTVISDTYNSATNAKDADKYIYLKTLVKKQIAPIIDEASTSRIKFIKKSFIASVQSFRNNYNDARLNQKIVTKMFEGIKDRLSRKPVEAYDWQTESVTFSLDFVLEEGGGGKSGPIKAASGVPASAGTSTYLEYYPGLEYDLFNNFKVDEYIPLIILCKNDNPEDRIFKAHVEDSAQLRLFKKKGPSKIYKWLDDYEAMSIIFYIYVGNSDPKTAFAYRRDFVRVSYSFRNRDLFFNRFTFTLLHMNVSAIVDRLNSGFGSGGEKGAGELRPQTPGRFVVQTPTAKNIIGIKQNFVVPGIDIDRTLMMHFISSDPVLAVLFRFNEQDNPWTQKKVLRFDMFLFGTMQIVMKLDTVTSNAQIMEYHGIRTAMIQGTKFSKVAVASESLQDAEVFRYILLRLYAAYNDAYEELYENYNFIQKITGVGELERTEEYVEPDTTAESLIDPEERIIFQLKRVNPEMWSESNYARSIALNTYLQVIPISKNQVEFYRSEGRDVILWPERITNLEEEWQAKVFLDSKGKRIQHFYTTSTAERKFITFVPNTSKTGENFPLLPKCQKEPSGIHVHSDWTITVPRIEKGKTKESVKTLKLLDPKQTRVANDIAAFVDVPECQIIGMPIGPNALLRCVAYALGEDKEEILKPDFDEIAEGLREELAGRANCAKQENYDKTAEQIAAEVNDPDVPLDSLVHYRLIEEVFEINLFTFTTTDHKDYVLVPPRSLPPYVRTHKDRPSVLVFRHFYKNKGLQYHHYELISSRSQGAVSFLFGVNESAKLASVTTSLARSVTVSPFTKIADGKAFTRYAIESSERKVFYFSSSLTESVVGQSFDSRGKVRSLTFRLDSVEGEKEHNFGRISVFTEPLEPFDKPIIEPVSSDLEALSRLSNLEGLVLSIKGYVPQQGSTEAEEPQLIGVWCTIRDNRAPVNSPDIECYISLNPTRLLGSHRPLRYEVGGVVQNESGKEKSLPSESATQALSRYQKTVAIYIQIMKRLYVKSGLTPDDFMDRHTTIIPGARLDVAGGDRYVPVDANSSFSLLLGHFKRTFPKLFEGDKIVADSEKTWTNVYIRLERYQKIREEQKVLLGASARVDKFPPFLSATFETVDDFIRHTRNEMIFMSPERIKLEISIAQESNLLLVTEINGALKNNYAPFFYLHESTSLFLVQNVKYGDKRRAQTVAKFWKQNNINTGFMTGPLADDSNVRVVSLTRLVVEDLDDVMVLEYDRSSYAAFLLVR